CINDDLAASERGSLTIGVKNKTHNRKADLWSQATTIPWLSREFRLIGLAKFLRSVLRLREILLQNDAILRNAARKRNYKLPSGSNGMQSSEMMRNSLGLNYKSAALNQLSYAGVLHTKAVFSELIKSSSEPISRTALQ